MSCISDLIERLAPNGVPGLPIGEFAECSAGATPASGVADYWEGGTIPWMSSGEVNNGTIYETEKKITQAGYDSCSTKLLPPNIVVMALAGQGKTRGLVARTRIALCTNQSLAAIVPNESVDSDYLWHYLRTQYQELRDISSGDGTRGGLNLQMIRAYKVPVPPVEVQREIVRVLDSFSALEAELEAELEARRLQYAHYRKQLVSGIVADQVPIASLGKWVGGVTPSKSEPRYWEAGTIPWLASMDVSESNGGAIRGRVTQAAVDETALRVHEAPSVAVVMRSNILRRVLPVSFVEVDTTVNQDVKLLIPREGVDAEYAFHALRALSEDIRRACVRTDGSMAAVDSKAFFAWPIPLPPYDEQRRIAAVLRKFDLLVNDLTVGLPAELNARRQQYEYYRDKLLTFEEAAA